MKPAASTNYWANRGNLGLPARAAILGGLFFIEKIFLSQFVDAQRVEAAMGIGASLRFAHLAGFSPIYRDFRAGDVRHSLADISKANRCLGYEPTHAINKGLSEAMEWYVGHLSGEQQS